MNKLLSIFILAFVLFSSCEDLPDEQFVKKVCFTQNGTQKKEIMLVDESPVTIDIPVSVSGTSLNDQDISISYQVYNDTIENYNKMVLRDKEDEYFSVCPEEGYTFSSDKVLIKAKKEYAVLKAQIDASKFDLHKRYILPLLLTNTSSFELSDEDYIFGFYKLIFKNSVSGNYSFVGSIGGNNRTLPVLLDAQTFKSCHFKFTDLAINLDDMPEDHAEKLKKSYLKIDFNFSNDTTVNIVSENTDVLECVANETGKDGVKTNFMTDKNGKRQINLSFNLKTSFESGDEDNPQTEIEVPVEGVMFIALEEDEETDTE